jgi:hypothetical protein
MEALGSTAPTKLFEVAKKNHHKNLVVLYQLRYCKKVLHWSHLAMVDEHLVDQNDDDWHCYSKNFLVFAASRRTHSSCLSKTDDFAFHYWDLRLRMLHPDHYSPPVLGKNTKLKLMFNAI